VRVIFQLLNAYLYRKTVTRSSVLNAALTLFLMAPFNIMGEIFGRLLPKNADLYLDNVVLAKKRGLNACAVDESRIPTQVSERH